MIKRFLVLGVQSPSVGLQVLAFVTGRNEVVAKVIFLHLSVILFTGGVCLNACWDTSPPRSRHPPGPGRHQPPRDQADPPRPGRTPPGPGRPPSPQTRQAPPPQTRQTPPGPGRHPPPPPPREADSSIRSTSCRYVSYWNAFLL